MKETLSGTRRNGMLRSISLLLLQLVLLTSMASGQSLPSPKEHFGFNIGDDYYLATYTQTEAYFKKLASSDRVKLVDIGPTEEGRRQYMLIISSPGNIKQLDKYREISEKLARAEGLSESEARSLSAEGKAVVWIDGGLHATEVVGTHQLIETAWQLVSRNDPETMNILENDIILLVHANPDGQELVSSWYMKDTDPLKRKMNIPRLYQKYVGHDNNRDFFMLSMKESVNISNQLYLRWFPQVLYNHHQAGPAGSVLAGPPYRDPFNYVFDPLVMTGVDALGSAMYNRLLSEGKPGYTMRGGASFSTWYNGGLRTTAYFHNMIGLLTEIIGSPTPGEVPLVPDRLLPSGSTPFPVTPGKWYFRQSIDYSVSLNYAILDYAARQRQELLYNFYRMGMNSITRGSQDNWTLSPKMIDAIKEAYNKDRQDNNQANRSNNNPSGQSSFQGQGRMSVKYYDMILKDPGRRDPRGYIIPSDQKDFPTAVKFVNTLIGSGIAVSVANEQFTVNGKVYPAGSYIVKTNQAFRPHVLDMFEPQDHPNDLQYPGGPPVPPYDAAGWTLAFQMDIAFDRILEDFDGPFTRIPYGQLQSYQKKAVIPSGVAGYLLTPAVNNSFIVVNDLLAKGIEVYRINGKNNNTEETGNFFVPASGKNNAAVSSLASRYGVSISPVKQKPAGITRTRPAKIAVWNRYGGSMPVGWLSWILEQYHFGYDTIYSKDIDAGDLKKKYDIIILTSGSVPAFREGSQGGFQDFRPQENSDIPEEYKFMTGSLTADKSIPVLEKFIKDGGIAITMETGTNLAYHMKLPVSNALVKTDSQGRETRLSSSDYYIPGSLLTASIATDDPAASGMSEKADVYFDQNPVFRFGEKADSAGLKKLAWFSGETSLHSGWALGQKYLKDGIIAFYAPVGKGKLVAFGPNITFRSQTHGMFRLLFNQLYTDKK
ncbi:MAG: M14 metallopeptidase family protein [Bacteroidales bacterium]